MMRSNVAHGSALQTLFAAALATSCTPTPEPPSQPVAPHSAARTAPSGEIAKAPATSVVPLRPWSQVMTEAPPPPAPAELAGADTDAFARAQEGLEKVYGAVEMLWAFDGGLLCAVDDGPCAASWSRLGALTTRARQAVQDYSGCPRYSPRSIRSRAIRHHRFLEERSDEAVQHFAAIARERGPATDQRWRDLSAPLGNYGVIPCGPLTIGEVLVFGAGLDTLSERGREQVRTVSFWIARNVSSPRDGKTAQDLSVVEIWAHATPSEPSPMDLAKQRADAVQAQLVKLGVDKDFLRVVIAGSALSSSTDDGTGNDRGRVEFHPRRSTKK